MGEYIIYYRGKIVGGIYDDRFLVKTTKSAKALMPEAELELPYEGAKEMLLVDNLDNKAFLRELMETMYDELRGYKEIEYNMIETENGDYLCYDVMRLEKADDNSGH